MMSMVASEKGGLVSKDQFDLIEKVVVGGDLSKLSPGERVHFYMRICDSLGLNYLTRPFEYITLNGKLTLYARKECTDQLRRINRISISDIRSQVVDDVIIVTAKAKSFDGREDTSTGVVSFGNLKGDAKANAMMKAETKAKRRVTLSISGLAMIDESEIDSVPSAKTVNVNPHTGEIEQELPALPEGKPTRTCISEAQADELSGLTLMCKKEISEKCWANVLKVMPNAEGWYSITPEIYQRAKEYMLKHIEIEKSKAQVVDQKDAPRSMDEVAQLEQEGE